MSDILQFASPCEAGLDPELVLNFLDDIEERKLMVHGMVLISHGKVCAEGYWKPFDKDFLHRMYSVSKTFVSAAIGALIDEGKISLDDKIASFFPDKVIDTPEKPLSPYMKDATIRDLLRMETPQNESTYGFSDSDWLATFFEKEPSHPAGTFFRYDTSGTYTLDVLVERMTGKTFLEYLKEKALLEIGFSKDSYCIEAPEGYAWGGSGVMCTTRDLARFAMLVENDGKFNGKQLLPADYLREAKKRQIDNAPYGYFTVLSGLGYGYQIWRICDNGYAFEGMGGQLALVWPDKDFIAVFTSDMQGHPMDYNGLVEALRYQVLNKLPVAKVAPKPEKEAELAKRLASLEPPIPNGVAHAPFEKELNGKYYVIDKNSMGLGLKRIRFLFDGDDGVLEMETEHGMRKIPFGLGHYVLGDFPETHYSGLRIRQPYGKPYREESVATWVEDKKLILRTYVIDKYFGNLVATFGFKGDEVGIFINKYAEDFMNEYPGMAAGRKE